MGFYDWMKSPSGYKDPGGLINHAESFVGLGMVGTGLFRAWDRKMS